MQLLIVCFTYCNKNLLLINYSVKRLANHANETLHKIKVKTLFFLSPASFGSNIIFHKGTAEYVALSIKWFPKVKLRPKHEFILHYQALIIYFGPLKHLWTLRFESKHGFFKKIVRHIQHFKNITQTLAEKHELMQCCNENEFEYLAKRDNVVIYRSEDYDKKLVSVITNFMETNDLNLLWASKKVFFRGITYSEGQSVWIGKTMYGNFSICTIQLILLSVHYSNVYFVSNTNEIICVPEIEIYEIALYDGCEDRL